MTANTKKTRIVPCPQCKQDSIFDTSNQYRPFCCERCKLIDLGQWANEGYTISSPAQQNQNFDN